VAGGSDTFLPSRALEAAGHSRVPDGARLKVRITQGPKGPQVAEVVGVDASTAQVPSRAERRPSPRPSSPRPGAGPTEECLGSVKWFNVEKGFGFVAVDTSPCCRGGNGPGRYVQNDDKREAEAFRALRRLFLRVQLSDPTTARTNGMPKFSSDDTEPP
jgi:cold shock CspA family protein